MIYTRPQEPWAKQAARGVGFVVGVALAVLAAGAVIAVLGAGLLGAA